MNDAWELPVTSVLQEASVGRRIGLPCADGTMPLPNFLEVMPPGAAEGRGCLWANSISVF